LRKSSYPSTWTGLVHPAIEASCHQKPGVSATGGLVAGWHAVWNCFAIGIETICHDNCLIIDFREKALQCRRFGRSHATCWQIQAIGLGDFDLVSVFHYFASTLFGVHGNTLFANFPMFSMSGVHCDSPIIALINKK
jgi:hypothetical protein